MAKPSEDPLGFALPTVFSGFGETKLGKRCKWCGEDITYRFNQRTKFCGPTHKSNFYSKKVDTYRSRIRKEIRKNVQKRRLQNHMKGIRLKR